MQRLCQTTEQSIVTLWESVTVCAHDPHPYLDNVHVTNVSIGQHNDTRYPRVIIFVYVLFFFPIPYYLIAEIKYWTP